MASNVFRFKHFNQFVRGEVKDEIVKRVIVNSQTGSILKGLTGLILLLHIFLMN